MKRDLGPKDLIFPAPVLIVGTYGQDGTPNAMNVAWGGICSSVPPAVAISIRETRRTFANIQAKGAFTVAIATEDLMVQADYVGLVSGSKGNKLEKAGLRTVKSEHVDAPRPPGLPRDPGVPGHERHEDRPAHAHRGRDRQRPGGGVRPQ